MGRAFRERGQDEGGCGTVVDWGFGDELVDDGGDVFCVEAVFLGEEDVGGLGLKVDFLSRFCFYFHLGCSDGSSVGRSLGGVIIVLCMAG